MAEAEPNILTILTDQQRTDTLGCYGARVCRTPHLDRVAAEGVRFTHAFTNTAICTAVRASLLTGLAPHRHGMLANFERNVGYPTELPERLVPFSRYLRHEGYRCALVGKWHLGVTRGPEAYGFEGPHYPGWDAPKTHPEYEAYLELNGLPRWSVRDVIRGAFPNGEPSLAMAGVYDGPVEGTYPYFLAERAIRWLREYAMSGRAPFHLSLHFFGPHLPYYVPESYATMYDPASVERLPSMAETFVGKPSVQRAYCGHWAFDTYPWETWQRVVAMYWGYVTLIDEQIGRVLAELDVLGLADGTAVLFSADHAGFVGGHRLADKGPMMYDEIYRIPLLARWPGVGVAGSTCDAFVTLMDLMPTFLDLARADLPPGLDGRSIAPLLRGERPDDWPDAVYPEFHGHHFPFPQRGIRTRTHKLVVNPADINELYDLTADPWELHNLYGHPSYVDVQEQLLNRLYAHLVGAGDNFYHWMTTMYPVQAQ